MSTAPANPGNRREYERRINRVIDRIRTDLAGELGLERLAGIAAFSPYHFHRVFVAFTGETLQDYVRRLRLERAAGQLVSHRGMTVTDIALGVGFSSPAAFARAFHKHFGMSASAWRAGGNLGWSAALDAKRNLGKAQRNPGKAPAAVGGQHTAIANGAAAMNVSIREYPDFHVAYMRHVGPYGAVGIPGLWERLGKWMRAHGKFDAASITLGVAHDDPRVVEPARCRYDACVVVGADFAPERSIDSGVVRGGTCAVTEFVGTAHEIEAAWDLLFRVWLPDSGYQPADRPCFELHRGDPSVPGEPGKFRCELCLPVQAL